MDTPTQTPPVKSKITKEEYLTDRIDDQIQYYERKSSLNKRRYYGMKTVVIVSGALIPILIGYSNEPFENLKYVAGFLGVIVTIAEGIMNLRKYQENWATYRVTVESLRREKLLFQNGVGDYEQPDEEEAFKTYVLKSEQILSTENSNWGTIFRRKDDSSPSTPDEQKPTT